MASFELQLINLYQVAEALENWGSASEEMYTEAMLSVGELAVELAQQMVDEPAGPVIDAGRNEHLLYDSIHATGVVGSSAGGYEIDIIAGGGGEKPGVAGWLEWGTGVYGPSGTPIVPSVFAGAGAPTMGQLRNAQMSAFGYFARPQLHWEWSWGEMAHADSVAGQPGRHYMERVIDEHSSELGDMFLQTLAGLLGTTTPTINP